jgi:hypothetical protein
VLRRISGQKREAMTGKWGILLKEQLYDLYF